MSLQLHLVRTIKKSILVIRLPLPFPFLQTFLLEHLLSCCLWSGCSLGPAGGMLSASLLANYPVCCIPRSLFSLTPSFWGFLFYSSCLWKASWGVKKIETTTSFFSVLRLDCCSPSEGLRPSALIFWLCLPAGLPCACCPQTLRLHCLRTVNLSSSGVGWARARGGRRGPTDLLQRFPASLLGYSPVWNTQYLQFLNLCSVLLRKLSSCQLPPFILLL